MTAGTKSTTVSGVTTVTTATVKVTLNGKTANKQVVVQQAANNATYGAVTITGGTVADIPASGGSVSSMSGISASQTVSFTSGSTRAGKVTISYSAAVSASSLKTTVKARTKIGTLTATATGEGSKSASKALDVYQQANAAGAITYGTPTVTLTVSDIPAKGGTISSGNVTYSQSRTQAYTSGATSTLSALTSGGSVSYSSAVSAPSLNTTVKGRTKIGILIATVTMNGKSGSKTATVYQAANEITSTEIGWKSITNNTEPQSGRGVYSGDTIQIELTTAATSFVGFPIEYLYYHYTSGAEYTEDFSSNVLQSTTMTSNVSFIDTGIGTTAGIISQNTSTSPRSGTVTCTYKYELKTYTLKFKITQPGVTNHLEVSPTSLSFTASGGTQTITIDTNESWTIS